MSKLLKGAAALLGSGAILGACGGKKGESKNVTISGSSSVTPLMEKLAAAYEQDHDVRITMNMSSSGAGISDTQNDLNDFGMSSRKLKDEEKGIKGETLCMDGIALIVNKNCDVTNVNKADVKALYENGDSRYYDYGGNRQRRFERYAFRIRRAVKNHKRIFQRRFSSYRNGQRDRSHSEFYEQHRLHFLRQSERQRKSGEP